MIRLDMGGVGHGFKFWMGFKSRLEKGTKEFEADIYIVISER